MITERSFASSFQDFWVQLLPLLTPPLVHLLSSGHEQRLLDDQGRPVPEVAIREKSRDAAVVAEYGYHLARNALSQGISVAEALNRPGVREAAQAHAIELVNFYEQRKSFSDITLNPAESEEGAELAERYELFLNQFNLSGPVRFEIPIPGAGFIQSCRADMAIDNYLVEVKTVNRGLASKDIRQLVVYLALSASSGALNWTEAGFFNPRRSTYHRFQTTELIELMSGTRSSVEIFNDFLEFVCASDVQIDHAF